MLINTKEKLRHYIRTQLGEPVVRVEVPDESIDMIIYESIVKFTDYSWEGELVKALVLEVTGMGEYTFQNEEVREVLKCVKYNGVGGISAFANQFGQNLVPDVWSDSFKGMQDVMSIVLQQSAYRAISEKYFGAELNHHFTAGKNSVRIFENFTGPLLVEYVAAYQPSEIDVIYNHPWIRDYALNRTKFLWGTITGKYTQNLVGGATINYGDMKQEAEQALQKLDEDLLNRYTDSAPIVVG